MTEVQVEAWRVHDTGPGGGAVALPPPRRSRAPPPGARATRGPTASRWRSSTASCGRPAPDGARRRLAGRPTCRVSRVAAGPPVSFVLEVPGSTHLLAAAADAATESAARRALLG